MNKELRRMSNNTIVSENDKLISFPELERTIILRKEYTGEEIERSERINSEVLTLIEDNSKKIEDIIGFCNVELSNNSESGLTKAEEFLLIKYFGVCRLSESLALDRVLSQEDLKYANINYGKEQCLKLSNDIRFELDHEAFNSEEFSNYLNKIKIEVLIRRLLGFKGDLAKNKSVKNIENPIFFVPKNVRHIVSLYLQDSICNLLFEQKINDIKTFKSVLNQVKFNDSDYLIPYTEINLPKWLSRGS